MNSDTQMVPATHKMREILCKWSGLSPQAQDAALTAWGSYIDGMAAQERLTAERPSA